MSLRQEDIDAACWRRISSLVEVALELDRATRAAYLETLGRQDADLQRRVISLLRSMGVMACDEESTSAEGSARTVDENRVGPWRLIRLLGRGGMGAVFLAERDDAEYERQVALKVIGGGFDVPIVHQRFLSERQILAGFDHPHIAKLFDAGTARDGRPYLVMEYVDGVPIDTFCFERNLSVQERLELFKKVCSAVTYAHRNLVVHRDLKPSNILVTPDGEPKLLDFGIAKLLDPGNFPVDIEQTGTANRPMTPNWASPEQLRGDAITTGTDVYALGLLLYKLLTGRVPYSIGGNIVAALAALEVPPSKPSQALAKPLLVIDGGETPALLAWKSETEISRVRRQLAGDLDNIVLKALRSEVEQRYASAEAFADDIQRHESDRPVSATADTFRYVAGRFIRRNRLALLIGGALAFLVIGFSFLVLHQSKAIRIEAEKAQMERDRVVLERKQSDEVKRMLADLVSMIFREQGGPLAIRGGVEVVFARLEASEDLDPKTQGELVKIVSDAFWENRDVSNALSGAEAALTLLQSAGEMDSQLYQEALLLKARALGHSGESRQAFQIFRSLVEGGRDPELQMLALSGYLRSGMTAGTWREIGEFWTSLFGGSASSEVILEASTATHEMIDAYAFFLLSIGEPELAGEIFHSNSKARARLGEPVLEMSKGAGVFLEDVRFHAASLAHQDAVRRCEPLASHIVSGTFDPEPARFRETYQLIILCGHATGKAGDVEKGLEYIDGGLQGLERLSPDDEEYRRQDSWRALAYFLRADLRRGDDEKLIHSIDVRKSLELLANARAGRSGDIQLDNTYAMALLLADRLEEARPLVADMVAKGWRRPDFMTLAEEKDALPDPLPPRIKVEPALPAEIQAVLGRPSHQ